MRPDQAHRAEAAFAAIGQVRTAIRELYAGLSGPTVRSYPVNLAPAMVPLAHGGDPVLGARHLADTMARHLRLAGVTLSVSFTPSFRHAGEVQLGSGPEYAITLDERYRPHPEDSAAVLAHEVMHVFLHRNGITSSGRQSAEILTDVAAVYLGTGWLLLNAQRTTATHWQRIGYLSPELFGYVLAKRSLAFDEDVSAYFAGNQAATQAYLLGRARALADYQRAPLAGCSRPAREQYQRDRAFAASLTVSAGLSGLAQPFAGGYRFDGFDPMRVVFRCPVCEHQLRVPVDRRVTIRCRRCRAELPCVT